MNKEGYYSLINEALEGYLLSFDENIDVIINSMSYSLLAPGKRFRPMLTLEFCRACGGKTKDALPFACAIEMIHTYSLIHDDLPCMDDDDYRRGRPSNHKKYGEATALLAGDALLTLAFEIMAKAATRVGADKTVKSIEVLCKAIGCNGMIGGQLMDISSEGAKLSHQKLNLMHKKKTGALISAASEIGCIIAGADKGKIELARAYAEKIGLAFQIVDDILDVTADFDQIGKTPGSDANKNKMTYTALMGVDAAKKEAFQLIQGAKESIANLGETTEFLINLADSICDKIR